jgi:hypothetical protein
VQVSDGLKLQAVPSDSSYGTGSHVSPMSPASPSVSAWVQHSVSPKASISCDAPGEFLVLRCIDLELILMLLYKALALQYHSAALDY